MLTVAYLANQYPAAVEPYVGEEIEELRRRGVRVIPGSVRKINTSLHGSLSEPFEPEILCLQPVRVLSLLQALAFAVMRWRRIADLLGRILLEGKESPQRRLKALLHTWLGAYYALQLRNRDADHIHVHHGYFGSWIAMVAARLLGVNYSLTLHGSDLLIHGAYLDTKLKNCQFCVTISEFNRRYIQQHFPVLDPKKIVVSRLGVSVPKRDWAPRDHRTIGSARRTLTLLAVGRLHPVKDHAFLVRACAQLRDRRLDFACAIAGEGPERQPLEALIRQHRLQDQLRLPGYVSREQMNSLYRQADVVVLTSRSEGIPLVLMEAMALGRAVLAPSITGIPEIVLPGKTGFLYAPGNIGDFVARILFIQEMLCAESRLAVSRVDWIRHAAQVQVIYNFGRRKNLAQFGEQFLQLAGIPNFATTNLANRDFATQDESALHENSVLQQI